jgi:hypothetical protein
MVGQTSASFEAPPDQSLERTQRGVRSFVCGNAAPPRRAAQLNCVKRLGSYAC